MPTFRQIGKGMISQIPYGSVAGAVEYTNCISAEG